MDAKDTLSIGRMRQNPTEALRRVREGAEIVITDRGRGVARLLPLAEPSWVAGSDLLGAFTPIDAGYWEDVQRTREEQPTALNPWERTDG